MCTSNEELHRRADWAGKGQASRIKLMEQLQGKNSLTDWNLDRPFRTKTKTTVQSPVILDFGQNVHNCFVLPYVWVSACVCAITS